jgi:hypothetical protein
MIRVAGLLLVALAGCAGSSRRPATCTLGSEAARAEFAAEARELGAKATRDDRGLHVALSSSDRGRISSFVHRLAARESVCCPFLKFRLEESPEVYILHVLADTDHGSTLDEMHKLISAP